MYEELRKPKLLKEVPLSLLRPLPVLYYANKYAGSHIPKAIQILYQTHFRYLCLALNAAAELTSQQAFSSILQPFGTSENFPTQSRYVAVQEMSTALATLCTRHQASLKAHHQALKSKCAEIFNQQVKKIRVLLVDNDGDDVSSQKAISVLRNFCLYQTDYLSSSDVETGVKFSASDFVILFSTASPHIHRQVEMLNSARKPGIALVHLDRDKPTDRTSIRHGRQLLKLGFPVLFNIFTPIRLFTSIDKYYLYYHLR